MTPNTTGPPFLAAVLATLLTPALVVTLPEAWPLGGLLLALAGPAALALVLVAPRHPLGLYLATGAAACAAMTVAGGIGLALRDSAGITWPRLFLENLLWNGAVLLFLGTAGIALGSLPLAARDSPPWRYALPGQLRLLAGIALTALLTVTWLPTTKNQGILVALVATGLAGGLLAGSWWSLPLLPLAVIATAWLWFLLDPPPPSSEPLGTVGTIIIWAIYAGAVATGAALGTAAVMLANSGWARLQGRSRSEPFGHES